MRCPTCGRPVTMSEKSYTCDCVTIPKIILEKKITPEIAHELLTNRQTKTLDGFISRKTGKTFSAALVIQCGEVKFGFEHSEIRLRVHSGNSGSAHVLIKGMMFKDFHISYGHVSSRMAECLACITAANLIKSVAKNISGLKIDISLNNLDFSRYILKERVPRDSSMKLALQNLFKLLAEFGSWTARCELVRRPKLTGSPHSKSFPKGVFPELNIGIAEESSKLQVTLPDRLDIQKQFAASIQRAEPSSDNVYTLPLTAKPVLLAWLSSVKKGA